MLLSVLLSTHLFLHSEQVVSLGAVALLRCNYSLVIVPMAAYIPKAQMVSPPGAGVVGAEVPVMR